MSDERPVTVRDLRDLIAETTKPPRVQWRTVWAAVGAMVTLLGALVALLFFAVEPRAESVKARADMEQRSVERDTQLAERFNAALGALDKTVSNLGVDVAVLKDRARRANRGDRHE